MIFSPIAEAIKELQHGKMLIVLDNPNRENQADIIFPAELATEEKINFLMQMCKGFICVALTAEKAFQLDLKPMVAKIQNTEKTRLNLTVTVDAKEVTDHGISAKDRTKTILALASKTTKPDDMVKPGHVLPILAAKNGLEERQGHTEATVTLCSLAGFSPVGVLCELLREDGNVAKSDDITAFAEQHAIKIISIDDLLFYVKEHPSQNIAIPSFVRREAEANLPTTYGTFKIHVYTSLSDNQDHTVLLMGNINQQPVLTRVHSQCLTGDTFHSRKCDCGEQLTESLKQIQKEGKGILLYLNQEGRDIGLLEKIKAYALQEQGLDTVEANEKLGFSADPRDYAIAADILRDEGVTNIRLLTNNPDKIEQLEKNGITIAEVVPLEIPPNEIDKKYLQTKKIKLKHRLTYV